MKSTILMVTVAVAALSVGCGTVGSVVTPTPVPVSAPEPTATPSLTDEAKAKITDLFGEQSKLIKAGSWEAAFETCTPSYRSRRDADRFAGDVQRYLLRLDTAPETLDVRNPEATKGRDDRFDLNYDLYIEGEFAETVRVGGAYVQVHGTWYDDGVWCR